LLLALAGPLVGVASVAYADSGATGETTMADDVERAAFARAFQAAVRAHDDAGLLDLVRPDAQIKERNAIVAAGPDRVAEWVRACVARRFALDSSSLNVTANGASWAFSDASGCYERTRPSALSGGRDFGPAGGVVELTMRDGKVATLTFTYSAEWEARRMASIAAPVLAAQAAVAHAAPTATAAAPLPTEDAPAALVSIPPAPDTQRRTTPSAAPWLGAAIMTTVVGVFAALKRPAPPA